MILNGDNNENATIIQNVEFGENEEGKPHRHLNSQRQFYVLVLKSFVPRLK